MLARTNANTRNARITQYSPHLDNFRQYRTDDPSPSQIATILRAIDMGEVAAMCDVQDEIEAKDLHLQGVASRRRESVTALDWSIVPDATTQEVDRATEAAEYCQRILSNLRTWEDTLLHLSSAIGPGVAVTEQVWAAGQLVETVDVPGHRLDTDPHRSNAIRVLTEEHSVEGIETYEPGFIVHLPMPRAGFPFRVTLTRANALMWVIKHFVISDWTAFSELFGQPLRIGTYAEEPSQGVRETVEDMLKNMAGECWGLFPEGIKIELIDAAKTNQPYEKLIDWIERKQSIAWLGQTLTTEPANVGSLALGRVHDNVRASITLSDIKAERRTIREQVLRPMTRLRWPQKPRPIPHFERTIIGDARLDERRVRLDELRFAKEQGLGWETEWLYNELNIPIPRKTEESET